MPDDSPATKPPDERDEAPWYDEPFQAAKDFRPTQHCLVQLCRFADPACASVLAYDATTGAVTLLVSGEDVLIFPFQFLVEGLIWAAECEL